jgi:hypothetical protein
MDYRLRREGSDLGVFSLEELRLRRESGELSGREEVQGEGKSDWQPLEAVLQAGLPVLPPPLPSPGLSRAAIGLIIAGFAIMCAGGLVYFGKMVSDLFAQTTHVAKAPESAPGYAAASKPATWKANSPTETQVRKRAGDFRLRQWLEGYDKRARRNPSIDAEAEQFIRMFIAAGYGGPDATNSVSPEDESERLSRNPDCTDPLVLTLAADKTRNLFDRRHRFERALAAFPGSAHWAYPKLYATVKYMGQMKQDAAKSQALNNSALALLPECFADGSFTPADQQEIAEIFVYGWGSEFFAANNAPVCYAVHQAGPSYQWLALVLDGQRYITEAWRSRGSGYADSVTSEGWQAFNKNLAEARSMLTQAWNLRPDFPLAPCLMMTVSLGDSDIGEMRTWFDRTLAAQFDFPEAWSNLRWGLRPRWHGSETAMLALGKTALNTGRFDTDVPRIFFDSVTDLESEMGLPAGRHIYGRPDIWPKFQKMYQGYIAEPSQATLRGGWRTSYTMVAYFAGKYDVAREQLEALGWKPVAANLTSWGVDLELVPLEVAARTGALGKQVSSAESAREAGDVAAALKQYGELATAPSDARTAEFIQRRLVQLAVEKRLREGEWVDLIPPGDHDPDWVYSFGEAHRLADGSLEVESGPRGHMLFSKVPMGANFEVRGSFDNVRSSNANFQAGIVMGVPNFERYNWYGFRIKRHDEEGDVVCLSVGWSTQQIVKKVPLNDTTNSFDFVLKDGHATATVNGAEVLHMAALPGAIHVPNDSFLIGLGAFGNSTESVVRYRDVQVRQLH